MLYFRFQILISDCFPLLEKYKKEKKKFDIVFADLTDTPLITDGERVMKEFWSLATDVLLSSLEILNSGGQFLTHVN